MSQRVSHETKNQRARVVSRVFKLLDEQGYTESDANEWIAGYCDITKEAVRRWRRGLSIPMGPRWTDLQDILVDLNGKAKEAKARIEAKAPGPPVEFKLEVETASTETDRVRPQSVDIEIEDARPNGDPDPLDDIFNGVCHIVEALPDSFRVLLWHRLSLDVAAIQKKRGV
jgi:hypothetical protein